jgi:hypothetical protein
MAELLTHGFIGEGPDNRMRGLDAIWGEPHEQKDPLITRGDLRTGGRGDPRGVDAMRSDEKAAASLRGVVKVCNECR